VIDRLQLDIRDATMLAIHLRDINAAVVEAWEQVFVDTPEVLVSQGDIFEHTADAIVARAP
jgi:hypothetical protein